jgi:tRNA(fMet)-specific endonuclease VapC
MSGPSRVLLDTNAVIALLAGNQPLQVLSEEADWVGISVLSQIEFLGTNKLTPADRELFEQLLVELVVIDLRHDDAELISLVTGLRRTKKLKLPDTVIVATAIRQNAVLVTADAAILGSELVACIAFDP